jgi:predicted nucleotidyltransferase
MIGQKVILIWACYFPMMWMVLQGSIASEHDRPKSDIDLGVLFSDDVDGFTRINMETEISNKIKKDVDLVRVIFR